MVEYSRQQGVSVWFWQHSNQLRTPEAREEVIDLYEALLRKAAEDRILIVFHGSNKPTGRERTWPNELVRESVRGMESSDSSVAHQIAGLVVFASPLLTIAGNPESILASPAVDVIRRVSAIWDETRVLAGSESGELVLFARRKGDVWFLAVMNGPGARAVTVPLSFLSAGRYQAARVRDDASVGRFVPGK